MITTKRGDKQVTLNSSFFRELKPEPDQESWVSDMEQDDKEPENNPDNMTSEEQDIVVNEDPASTTPVTVEMEKCSSRDHKPPAWLKDYKY